MTRALSVDLRDRVVAAVEGGLSRRQAAARFGVSISSAIRWTALSRATGDVRPKRIGGDKRSGRIEAYAPVILARSKRNPTSLWSSCVPFWRSRVSASLSRPCGGSSRAGRSR